MVKEKPALIIKKEYHKWRIALAILLLIFTLGSLLAGVIAVYRNQELRGRASGPVISPSPFITAPSLPPVTDIEPPYMRLFVPRPTYGFSGVVPVEVYLNTDDQPTMETTVVVTYDEEAVEIADTDIETADVYKSMSADTSEPGKVMLTLFVTPAVGHKPVATTSDTKIATLNFRTRTLEKKVWIDLAFTRGSDRFTTLVPFSEKREGIKNILQNAIDTQFTIVP